MTRVNAPKLFSLCVCLALFSGCGSESSTETATDTTEPGSPQVASAAASTPAETVAEKVDLLHPEVVIQTASGEIKLRLDAENSPITVRNFLNYVNSSHYDQSVIHYVNQEKMILGGGYNAELLPKEVSMAIRNEAHNGLKNTRGKIAMLRNPESIDSATCEFFINTKDNPDLDYQADDAAGYGYCVFGEVVEGLGVVDKIAASPVHDEGDFVSTPQARVVIESVRQLR